MSMPLDVRGVDSKTSSGLFPQGTALDRSRPAGEQVYAHLRRAIVTWRLRPGDAVAEHEITRDLDISRTPLREALRRLAEDGLVVIRPQAGTFVSVPDRHGWEEGRAIRRALELEGVRFAADRVTDDDLQRLAFLISQQERAVERNATDASFELDDDFHAAVSRLSGFPRLWKLIDGAKAQIDRFRYAAMPDRGHDAIVEHRQILDALRSRDADQAAALLARHLDASDQFTSLLLDRDLTRLRANEPTA